MKQTVAWMVGISIVMVLILIAIIKMQRNNSTGYVPEHPTPTIPYIPQTEKPTEPIRIVLTDGLPTAVLVTDEPTEEPSATPTPTVTPTIVPTVTQTVKKPTNTPKPTKTPTPTEKAKEKPQKASYGKGTPGTYKCEVNGTHTFKPWTSYKVYNMKASPQYKLQGVAETEEHGLRVVKDASGTKRYCIALGTAWGGGSPSDIGRCIDIHMKNGSVLHCVLSDVKKVEHTVNNEGRYGVKKKELIEFIVDRAKLLDAAKRSGDCSSLGEQFKGEATKIVVFDEFIPGFGK